MNRSFSSAAADIAVLKESIQSISSDLTSESVRLLSDSPDVNAYFAACTARDHVDDAWRALQYALANLDA